MGEHAPARRTASATQRTFKLLIAILIAVASITGVLSAWLASMWAGDVSGLNQQGLQHLVHMEQERNKLTSIVDQDLRLQAQYLEHHKAGRALAADAAEVRAQHPRLAAVLDLHARQENTLARSLHRFFLTEPPRSHAAYDARRELKRLEYFSQDMNELRPHEIFKRAEVAHARVLGFEGLTALFAVSLFLLTLAELARSGVRHYFAVTGEAVTAVGLVMFTVALSFWGAP